MTSGGVTVRVTVREADCGVGVVASLRWRLIWYVPDCVGTPIKIPVLRSCIPLGKVLCVDQV